MTSPADSAAFRRRATAVFRAVMAGLVVAPVGLAALGWWLLGWWGLAGGGVLGGVVLVLGAAVAGFFYAMSQDGA